MRILRWLLTLLAAFAMAGAIALPAASASSTHVRQLPKAGYAVVQVNPTTFTNVLAKQLTKEPLAGAWIIRTKSCTSVCYEVTAEGNGRTMQMHSTGFSTFNRSYPSGAQGYIYTTPNGLCVHGTDGIDVEGSNSACGAGNTASQWFDDGNGRLQNSAYNTKFMGTPNLGNGYQVLMEPSTGAYYLTPQDVG